MATKKKLGSGRHLSAIKRHRQIKKIAEQNKGARSAVRSIVKKTLQAIENSDKKAAEMLLTETRSLIDRAIKRGLYHPRTGQRKISRLHRRLNSLAS